MNAVTEFDLAALIDEVIQHNATVDLHSYDRFYVAFSGGKDSIALVLHLLDEGVPREKIELHHHLIDGRSESFMDWPITESYCLAFAAYFGLKIYMSYREGGIEREMLRENARTAPVSFESEDGTLKTMGGSRGELTTRRKFPQQSGNMLVRWCSGCLKTDVASRMLCNEPRFAGSRTLVLTGERAEESPKRAVYAKFEPHRNDKRHSPKLLRHIDVYRAVLDWPESKVWEIMERYKVRPHPAYQLGFGRCSCRTCIFSDKDQWATVKFYFPPAFKKVATYENEFGVTIHRSSRTVDELAAIGVPYHCNEELVALAQSTEYTLPILWEDWQLPPGAYKKTGGPS